MIEDLSDVVAELATGSYTVTRHAAQSTDGHGRVVEGATSPLTITAVITPANGQQLQRLDEGLRMRAVISVITAAQLQLANVAAGTPPDLITYQGDSYQLEAAEPWAEAGGFNAYLAVRVGD